MNYFLLDASALVKRFYVEKGSALVNHLFSRAGSPRLSCLMLGAAEVAATLARKRNSGLLSIASFAGAIGKLATEILDAADFMKYPADNSLIRTAIGLLHAHAINSSDAVALQTTLDVANFRQSGSDNLILVASDQRLLKAAQAEGLVTFDPESQTQAELDQLIGP